MSPVKELDEHWKLGECGDCKKSVMLMDHAEAAICPYCGAIESYRWRWGRLRIYFVEDALSKSAKTG